MDAVSQSDQLVQLPSPSNNVLVMVLMAFLALLLVAVLMDVFRRRAVRKGRTDAEWRSVRDIFKEKELSEKEMGIVQALIKRHAPAAPLRVVTVRQEFEGCVDAEMALLEAKGDQEEFDRVGVELRDIRALLSLDYVPLGQKINSSRDLVAGQSLSVAQANREDQEWAAAMIEDVDESYFYISAQDRESNAFPRLRVGEEARFRLWRDEDARYLFTARVAAKEGPPPVWKLKHTNELNRYQARAHFRVRFNQAVQVGILNAPVDGDVSNVRDRRPVSRLRGRVTSLSAGGCALVLQQPVAKQILLRIAVELPGDGTPLELEARIVSSAPISGGRQLIRTAFVGLDDERRDRLAKYVLHRQQQSILAAGEAGKP